MPKPPKSSPAANPSAANPSATERAAALEPQIVVLAPPAAPDAALESLSPEFEVVQGPDMTVHEQGIRGVLQTIQVKRDKFENFKRATETDVAYDILEIGWHCLRAKAAIDHGMAGRKNNVDGANQHALTQAATANLEGSDTVSVSSSGFGGWLVSTFAEINERSARRYMNAARNMKLMADTTLEQVRALRDTKALEGKRLTDLYLPPKGESEGGDPEADAERARAEAETKRFEESLFDLQQLGMEKRVFHALPKARLKLICGQLKELLGEVNNALRA